MNQIRISLRAARVNAGLSQSQAADTLGISRGTLRNYEDGKTTPNWNTVKKMETAYGLSADNIFFPETTLKAN